MADDDASEPDVKRSDVGLGLPLLTGSLVPVAWLEAGDTAEIIIDGLGQATFRLAEP